jgi:adhesin transport system outer membrane protein
MKRTVFVFRQIFNKMPCVAAVAAIALLVSAGSVLDLNAADDKLDPEGATIDSSVTSTLASNPRLLELKQNREAVQKDLRQAKGRNYPRLDLDLGYGTDSHSDIGTRGRDEEYDFDSRGEASIKLVQPLYQGGENRSLVKKQTANLDSVSYRVTDNAESLALDAIIAHLEVWRQRQLMDLTKQNIKTHEKILDNISERQRAGAGSSADVVQTKGRIAITWSSYTRIAGELESARVNYNRVVGRYPEKLQLPENFRILAPTGPDEAVKVAQVCNPKLAALAADIRAAKSQIGVAKSNYWPKVNLELSSTYQDQVESSTTYTHNNAAMVRAHWNLFSGGGDKAASDAASSRSRQLTAARKDQYQKTVEQIRDTWSQYQISGQQIQTFTKAEHYYKKTRDAYQQQFVVGQRSLLDVLDSENELFQTSAKLITAKVNEIIAVYRLLALSGCLLNSLEVDSGSYGITEVSGNCCNNVQRIDSDGDGVPDNKDRCPSTPANVKVDGQGCPVDSDSDGVPDFRDKCPNTKPGAMVNENGCALDSDGDGVLNSKDECPGTPSGVIVDSKGCPRPDPPKASKSAMVTATGTFLYKDIRFETNKWDLKTGSYDVLEEIAAWLTSKPNLMIEIQGHSDSRGPRAYNIDLSQRRAQAIIAYLVHKGIDTARMKPKGYGPDRPIASNDNAAGRAKNRRVEIKPLQW